MTRHLRSGPERLLHWLNAAAILILIGSGWEIFRADPFYPVAIPPAVTLGDDLTAALRLHFAAMWLCAVATVALLLRRLLPERAVRLWPISPRGILRDATAALRGRLGHDLTAYNHIQRGLYVGVFVLIVAAILSGLALWKPVQLALLADAIGGYEAARRVHFWTMAAITAFVLLHVTMALVVPRTLAAMLFGLAKTESKR